MGHFLRERVRGWVSRIPVRVARRAVARPEGLYRRLGRYLWVAARAFVVISILLILMLRWVPVPTSSFMLQSRWQALWAGEGTTVYYDWIPKESISPNMALAVIAAEDQRFPDHYGFDFVEIQDALDDRDEGKPLRGASTISQQVAKNLFLWSGRSFIRKGLEVWFTVLLELLWSKERILEVYLNVAEFGDDTFGVEAASRRFFNKSAARLTANEAARLAAVLPNPVRYRVDRPSLYVFKRQRWIRQQMQQLGGVSYLDKL